MTSSIKHVNSNFGDIAYAESGSGRTALFIHGVFLNHHFWRHVIPLVSDIRRCIALDLMAHGGTSIDPGQDVSFTAQAEMIKAFCDKLALDQVDLVANDSGGGIAQIFAARFPERIRTLTLTNCDTHDNWPPPRFRPLVELARAGQLAPRMRGMLNDIALARTSFAIGYENPKSIPDETFRTYLAPLFATDDAARNLERFVAAQDCSHTLAVESGLRALTAPTLVVWGTDDIFFPIRWAYWLRQAIPGCKRVIELEGARLFLPEERPDALASALREHWAT